MTYATKRFQVPHRGGALAVLARGALGLVVRREVLDEASTSIKRRRDNLSQPVGDLRAAGAVVASGCAALGGAVRTCSSPSCTLAATSCASQARDRARRRARRVYDVSWLGCRGVGSGRRVDPGGNPRRPSPRRRRSISIVEPVVEAEGFDFSREHLQISAPPVVALQHANGAHH
jgi:hypothetical protein